MRFSDGFCDGGRESTAERTQLAAEPLELLERQGTHPDKRRVPDATVRAQHMAMVHAHPALLAEGFNKVVFASNLYRPDPYLRHLGGVRNADFGLGEGDGLGDLMLAHRFFGPEILPL